MTVQDRASTGVKPAMPRVDACDAAERLGQSGKKRGRIGYRMHRAGS
jgi:hypothetical protein